MFFFLPFQGGRRNLWLPISHSRSPCNLHNDDDDQPISTVSCFFFFSFLSFLSPSAEKSRSSPPSQAHADCVCSRQIGWWGGNMKEAGWTLVSAPPAWVAEQTARAAWNQGVRRWLSPMQISKALHYLLSPCNLVSERANEVLNQDKGEAGGGELKARLGVRGRTHQPWDPRWSRRALREATGTLAS